MTIQQMFVAFACILLASQQITAVVNNQKSNVEDVQTATNDSSKIQDSSPAASEPEAKRREAPAISDTYGLPLSADSYVPSGPSSNQNLPLPVYGVPDGPPNNIVYPAPPPDIPPPPSASYGAPLQTYGLPQTVDFNDFVPPPPPIKPFNLPPKHLNYHSKPPLRPRPQYGPPPKPIFVPKVPKPTYGPPKPIYGPPKAPLFVPQKHFKQQVNVLSVPHGPPHQHYGPPEPIPHGPPHPGVPAPPTPPDIKYDGWQPIPGLVSRPPADTYGVPEPERLQQHHNHHHHADADLTPPPVHNQPLSAGYIPPATGISDSYGAPLNSVTGSGAIVSTPADQHDDHSLSLGLSAAGINAQNQLSVVKSIGYELFQNGGGGDSYSSPPLNSYSSDGPYPAKISGSIKSNGVGLIPPGGFYGVPPSGQYGTPLLNKPNPQYGPPLNALRLNQPKHPVLFRDPIPPGLIESVGQFSGHQDHHHDISSPPSSLYSLPNPSSSISFQQGSSYAAPLGSIDGSYGVPNSYDHATVALDNSLPPVTIDLTSAHSNLGANYQVPHQYYDCKSHGSQPLLTYGVPSANTYTAALSSLTTNIGSYATQDLEPEHSRKVATSVPANAIDNHGKTYGKSLAQSFGPDTELIQSQSIDVNNIPIKGSLGSYTLNIQSSGSTAAESQASHSQVLNGGLLESILAAIEQPEKDPKILGRPISQLGEPSEVHPVLVPAPVTEPATTTTVEGTTEAPLKLIDNNEIALYFSNKDEDKKNEEVRNGQQYGSYVSFKTPNASYQYGNAEKA